MAMQVPSGATPSLIECDLSEIQKMRECARCLLARAMLKLGDGDVAGCQSDLITVRRMGRLLTQRGSMVQCLVGIAVQGLVAEGESAMLESGLSAPQIDDYRSLFEGLPAGGNLAKSIDVAERTMGLSAIQQQHEMGQNLDLNLAFSIANEFYDSLAAGAADPPDLAARRWVEDRLIEIESRSDGSNIAKALLGGRQGRTELKTEVLMATLCPAIDSVESAFIRAEVYDDLLRVALDLESYKVEHGDYPAGLSDLGTETPVDRFGRDNTTLFYRKTEGGYLLYSVGDNGQDDNGVSYDDGPDFAYGDDVRISIGAFEPAVPTIDED